MARPGTRAFAATCAFGILHSLLASRAAKQTASKLLGRRNRAGFYRLFFNAQAIVSFVALLAYVCQEPNRVLYDVRGWPKAALRLGQLAAIGYLLWTVRQIGALRFFGVASAYEWLKGNDPPLEPEAQGPALSPDQHLRTTGPFALHRHPVNVGVLPVFWLNPRMTEGLFAMNLATTMYVVLGSIHEEHRLRQAYGEPYEAYQRHGPPFLAPSLPGR